jgi:AcrR family transcriptional regulator
MLEEANTERADLPSDRRAARTQATKDEILEAAWELVRKHGLAALSLRELAARVGMRAPSLYQYFPSKLAIYDAMFGQASRAALDAMNGDLPADRHEAMRTLAHRVFGFATSDPVRAQLLFQRTIPDFEPSPESYAPSVEMSARLGDVLAEYGFDDPDAADLWTALVGGLIAQQLANDPGGTRWARLIDRTADMFVDRMGPRNRAPRKKGK